MSVPPGQLLSRNLSMGEYLKHRYQEASRSLACRAQDTAGVAEWQDTFRRKLYHLMAPWPGPAPLNPITLERTERDGLIQEKILFSSEEDMAVPAYMLVPRSARGQQRYATVICQHGHGYGKDDVVGLTHGTVKQWDLGRTIRYDYGWQLAKAGYAVLAMDARGFGERALGYDFGHSDDMVGDESCTGCNIMQIKAQLLGLNLMTLNVFDIFRCLDYLAMRDDVDMDRIGCVGLSYGGALTLFSGALDERIKVAVVSGFLGYLYEQTFVRGDTCGQQVVPDLLAWAELPDVACLIAPRPLLIQSGDADPQFGIAAAEQAHQEVHRVYKVLGAPDRVALATFQGGHSWDQASGLAWLRRWL